MRATKRHLAAATVVAVLAAPATFPGISPASNKTLACKPKRMDFPFYPPDAIRIGAEGEVLVKFQIDQHGLPHDARVLASSPNGALFEKPSLKIVKNLACSDPTSGTKPRDVEHWFRAWIFFNLVAAVGDSSPAPEATELSVDEVIQVTGTRIRPR